MNQAIYTDLSDSCDGREPFRAVWQTKETKRSKKMDDKRIFIIAFAVACVAFMLAINDVCKRMNEYEAEHGCKYTGFGLCETYD